LKMLKRHKKTLKDKRAEGDASCRKNIDAGP